MMQKKIRMTAVSLVLFFSLFFSTIPVVLADDNTRYGEDAVYYMQYIQDTYPERIPESSQARAAGDWLIREIGAIGYQTEEEEVVWPGDDGHTYYGRNIIFTKKGNTDREIVIGAHYDSVDTSGADDNASGVGLLLETAIRIIDVDTNYTIRFILFDLGEYQNVGSRYHVNQASQEYLDNIACYINLDTLAMGDSMYVYGGGFDGSATSRTWLVEQAVATAEDMGLNISLHPDVNTGYPVPTKATGSDQAAFDQAGIPYLYMNASNWVGGNYDDSYQTDSESVSDGRMKHRKAYDNWEFYTNTFPGRAYDHLSSYSRLLDRLIRNLSELGTSSVDVPLEYEKVNEAVWAISNVKIREDSSTNSEEIAMLNEGEPILRVGYNREWSKVKYEGRELYIASAYLTTEKPEGAEDLPTVEPVTEEETPPTTPPETLETATPSETTTAVTVPTDDSNASSGLAPILSYLSGIEMKYYLIGGIGLAAVIACVIVFIYQRKHRY